MTRTAHMLWKWLAHLACSLALAVLAALYAGELLFVLSEVALLASFILTYAWFLEWLDERRVERPILPRPETYR